MFRGTGLILLMLTGCAAPAMDSSRESTTRPAAPVVARVPNTQVNVIAMGDWGNRSQNQRRVATAMADYVAGAGVRFDAAILAGDNFYVQLWGVDDPKWQTMFELMYDASILAFPFYASLGNHDYENGKDLIELAYARANPDSRWKMPARWYRVDLPDADAPLVTILMLDSNRTLMGPRMWREQLRWIEQQLAQPRAARWVVMCAHHPLFSNGDHGDNGVIQREWGPLLERYQLDFYVCGHDHDLQHLEMAGRWTSFLLVGGGGAGIRPMRNDQRGPFSRSSYGFAHLQFLPDRAIVRFVDADGEVLHAAQRSYDADVSVMNPGGRDAAQPRSVKSITRPDLPTTQSTK